MSEQKGAKFFCVNTCFWCPFLPTTVTGIWIQ